ncbi:MAG TPA: patatin-like phospholipase family protein [Burkholderiaceae bacterium]|nr:patatin-like phospholipase family protein [Burkholderiaceae bacterium]
MHGDQAFDPRLEHPSIRQRRTLWGPRTPGAEALAVEHPVGLAFSGGGIRSAIFSLGLAQALAQRRLFPQVDYLSTVSGGGYTGAFLGSLFLPRQSDFTVPDPLPRENKPTQMPDESPLAAAERVEQLLTDDPHRATAQVQVGDQKEAAVFHPILWLRENGRYLTPSGASDLLYLAAFYLRALFGVHYVLGLALLGGVLFVYAFRLGLHLLGLSLGGPIAPALDGLDWDVNVSTGAAWWSSPIFWLAPALAVLVGGPLVLAYWLVFRQEKAILSAEERAIKLGPWWLLVAAAVFGVLLGRFDQWTNPVVYLLGYGVYLAVSVLLMQRFWISGWLKPGEDWTFTAAVARARLKLTQALSGLLKVLLVILACALVDSLGQCIFVAILRARPVELATLGTGGGAIALLLALARKFSTMVPHDAVTWKKLFVRTQKWVALVAALLGLLAIAALLVAFVQWVVWSPWLVDWRVKAQAVLRPGHAALLIGLVLAWALLAELVRESLGFLNNSTFHRLYSARLVRTFLGAANLKRLAAFQRAVQGPLTSEDEPRKLFVSEAHPDDEVALRSYYGGTSAGPLHLICATLNESLSETSNLVREDRKGVTLAIGPRGINVDCDFYQWAKPDYEIGSRLAFSDLHEPAATAGGVEREAYDRQRTCERLPLGSWGAISGAAVSTGLGHMSSLGYSILAWLVNARLGYWWLPAEKMCRQQRDSALKTFDLVRQELSGGFYGQRGLRWSVSDGGHFENTAVYELLRRRAALIVCSDNGADPEYRFNDVQNLVRRARIDLGAEIEFMDEPGIAQFVSALKQGGADVGPYFGTLEQFGNAATRADRCALVARVRYATDAAATGLAREALLIIVKPSVTQFAPLDVKLYALNQLAFPQQPTGDQFFDEGQWECYRKLGQEIGLRLFTLWDGYVKVAREMAAGTY